MLATCAHRQVRDEDPADIHARLARLKTALQFRFGAEDETGPPQNGTAVPPRREADRAHARRRAGAREEEAGAGEAGARAVSAEVRRARELVSRHRHRAGP